jgi:hypothetical protein
VERGVPFPQDRGRELVRLISTIRGILHTGPLAEVPLTRAQVRRQYGELAAVIGD